MRRGGGRSEGVVEGEGRKARREGEKRYCTCSAENKSTCIDMCACTCIHG